MTTKEQRKIYRQNYINKDVARFKDLRLCHYYKTKEEDKAFRKLSVNSQKEYFIQKYNLKGVGF